MESTPLFSIVIPCYNSSATILEALRSVFRQTCNDFEIIIVDDGSVDDSAEKVAEFTSRRPRVTIIRQSNGGVSRARNGGIQNARGRLIAFLDADDFWDPRFLETHARRFQADPSLGLSFSVVRFVDHTGRGTGEYSRPKLSGLTADELLATNPCTTCSSIAVRREVIADIGEFDTELRRAEDQEWLFRVALSPWKIEGVRTPLVSYRNSADGLSSNLDGMYADFLNMLDRARQRAPELVDKSGPIAAARMSRYLARRALRLRQARSVARRYMAQALIKAPRILLNEPKQTLATLVSAYVPGCDAVFRRLRTA